MVCSMQLVGDGPFSGHLALSDTRYVIMDSRAIFHLHVVGVNVAEMGTSMYRLRLLSHFFAASIAEETYADESGGWLWQENKSQPYVFKARVYWQ